MTIKMDMIFSQQSNKNNSTPAGVRVGGWSEGFYSEQSIENVKLAAVDLCRKRAACLTSAAAIVGQRFRIIGGGSSTAGRQFPGVLGIRADIPQMALLCTMQGEGVANVRKLHITGLPDAQVEEGEYNKSAAMTAALNAFAVELQAGAWRFKARNLASPQADIISISTLGEVVTATDLALTGGQKVRILRAQDVNGVIRSGLFLVKSATDTTHFSLNNWPAVAVTNGKARREDVIYPVLVATTFAVGRVVTRKVGRSPFQYVGRRSKRT